MRSGNMRKFRLFRNDRAREWTVDFIIGVGLFVSVAFFAGVHEAPALPAPLAKSEAMIEQTAQQADQQIVISQPAAKSMPAPVVPTHNANTVHNYRHKILLFAMGVAFSSLSAITFQFWRYLRREYASPRRIWGRD